MATPPSDNQGTQDSGLVIPDEIQQQFGELITLIQGSESMNNEERQYWVNILPIMTPDQIENLRTILVNEQKQLAAIDKKYSQEIERIGTEELVKKTAAERKARRMDLHQQESQYEQKEEEAVENLLDQIESL